MGTLLYRLPLLFSLWPLLSSSLLSIGAAAISTEDEENSNKPKATKNSNIIELAEAQIEWLRTKCGGYYSTKISIEPLFDDDHDESSSSTDQKNDIPLGLFAKEGMIEGEKLMIIPRHCLLTSQKEEKEEEEEEEENDDEDRQESTDMCITAMNLVHERQLGDQSKYEPYVSYLFSKERISIPSNWSTLGQELILSIRGESLPPNDLTDVSFEDDCGDIDATTTEDLEFAYLSVVSRAWSDKLVPVFDMINHHSGRFFNVDSTSVHGPDDVTVHAIRDIQAGEQLFLSYMDCIDEKGHELEYVLPQMLRDFGFVDQYPQRWTFPGIPDDPEEPLVFDIDYAAASVVVDQQQQQQQQDGNGEDGGQEQVEREMLVSWYTEEPTSTQKSFLLEQLTRLRNIHHYVKEVAHQLESEHEREVALNYYYSLNLSLQYAIGENITAQQGQEDGVCTTRNALVGGDVCASSSGNTEAAERQHATDSNASSDDESDEDHVNEPNQSSNNNDGSGQSEHIESTDNKNLSEGDDQAGYHGKDRYEADKHLAEDVAKDQVHESPEGSAKQRTEEQETLTSPPTIQAPGDSSHTTLSVTIGSEEEMPEDDMQPTGSKPDEWMACDNFWRIEDDFEHLTEFSTHYQDVDFYWSKKEDDVCLYLDGYLHTCASSRPHYHEVFVHYAARFVDQVKRIIFIGGGDSKVLHEALKYPSLELVVGLELDNLVVRSSFTHFGTQPHFDNDKVEWYFGDAAKSLSVLPRSYYGSFDLVIVDILTEVASSLRVNDELTLLEAAMLLMKPDGIIVKNEDQGYVPGSSNHHTNYAVDLVFHDVPHYCLQVFVAASNSVDFLTKEPIDHNIETLYLKDLDDFKTQFDTWYNFGVMDGKQTSKCDESKSALPTERDSSFGLLMILEAERISIPHDGTTLLTFSASLAERFGEAAEKAGLTGVDYLDSPLVIDGMTGSTTMILATEGYVTARCIPSLDYCAFDIFLYGSSIEKMEAVKAELIGVVRSQQTSSFRFVTGGMFGRDNGERSNIGPPTAADVCEAESINNEGMAPAEKFRREKGFREFGSPQHASLHSYNNTKALKQWQSQGAIAGQIHVQLEVAPFWVGEEVLILKHGDWHYGTIKKVRPLGKYEVVYNNDEYKAEKRVGASRIRKASDKMDKGIVGRSLVALVNRLWASAEQNVDAQSVKNDEVAILHDDTGDGLILAFSWNEGTMIISWDGKSRVMFNFFVSPAAYDLVEAANDVISDHKMGMLLSTISKDDFPRGTSSVVNFPEEVGDELPLWA